jgi:hypothetical protein
MTGEPPRPPAGGGTSGLLAQLLAYVDKPWKVGAVIALFVVGGAGWIVYEQRDELFEAWLTPDAAALDTGGVPAALDKLVEDSGADLVQIWAVDLGANSQRFLAARRSDGQRPIIPSPRRLPVIVSTSDIQAVVNVLAGHPACGDTGPRESPLMRRLADRGMQRACAMPIPPSPEAFVGVIYLAWREPPGATAEDVAVGAAREVARTLVSR